MTTSSAPAPSQAGRAAIASAKRIVVKIGSSSLTNAKGRLDVAALRRFVDVLAERKASGTEIVLVTSGAVAAGMGPLELGDRPRDLATVQAVASVGQGMLIAQYADAFAAYDIRVGQLLLTAEDTVRRSRYRNAGRTIERRDRVDRCRYIPAGIGIDANATVLAERVSYGGDPVAVVGK